MKSAIFVLAAATVVLITIAIGSGGLWRAAEPMIDTTVASEKNVEPSAAEIDGSNLTDEAEYPDKAANAGPTRKESSQSWPPDMENQIWEFFSHQPDPNITSIVSVQCTETKCEIVFTGTEVNPQYVDEYSVLNDALGRTFSMIQSGSLGRREIAPGARAFVITISNQEFDDPNRLTNEEVKTRPAIEQ